MDNATSIPVRRWRERHRAALSESHHNLRIFLHDKLAVIGCVIILLFVCMAIFAPWLAPYPEQGRGVSNVSQRLQAPSAEHLLGTDEAGRDILSRVIFGARLPLVISALVAVGILAIGVPLGGIAGYYGGMVDEVLMRITDVFLSFPSLILAMLLVAFAGPSLRNVGLALIVAWWPWYTRLVRSMAISLRQRPYAMAARTMGVSNLRIIVRHILPNSMGPVIVQITLDVGSVILAIAGLSFIGLGAQQPTPEWGLMVASGREYIFEAWWYPTFPGLAILLLVLAYNLVGDGLRDVFDPRTKR